MLESEIIIRKSLWIAGPIAGWRSNTIEKFKKKHPSSQTLTVFLFQGMKAKKFDLLLLPSQTT